MIRVSALRFRVGGMFVLVKMDPLSFRVGYPFHGTPIRSIHVRKW